MSKKSIIILLTLLVTLCLVLSACDFLLPNIHIHAVTDAWKSDDTKHWHECACGYKSGATTHSYSEWIIDTPASETSAGSKHAECTVCHRTITVEIPQLSDSHQHTYLDNWFGNAQQHWKECACGDKSSVGNHDESTWIVDIGPTTEAEGSKHTECTICHRQMQTASIDKLTSGERTVDIYAINDFHGKVDRMSTVAGYLTKMRTENPNSVIVNSGDMFQGSMESNSNFGKLLSDCMDNVGFDSFTFGNHEFDWGLQNLETLSKNSSTPFLGANIYHYDMATGRWGTFASEFAQKYTVKTLENGIRIGIIGVIGKDQITSISSNLVQTIGFKDPADVIPELSNELRTKEGCNLVIVSAHTGPETFLDDSNFDITKYADAVLCAHTHKNERNIKNGVPFLQGGSYGSNVSHIKFVISEDGKLSCDTYENTPYSYSWPNKLAVTELIDNSNEKIQAEAAQVLANVDQLLDAYTAVPRLVSHAIANFASQTYSDIDLVMVNQGRSGIPAGPLTYSSLYESIPFDNQVYVAMVKGSDILNEAKYNGNEVWRVSGAAITNNKYYKIAVIDYLLYHQNSNREYNYFKSAFSSGFEPVALQKEGYVIYNYRLITRDFLLNNSNISFSNYTQLNEYNNKNNLGTQVTLDPNYGVGGGPVQSPDSGNQEEPSTPTPTLPVHAGTQSDPYDVSDAIYIAQQHAKDDAVWAYVTFVVGDMSSASISSVSGDIGNWYATNEQGNVSLKIYYLSKFYGSSADNNWTALSDVQTGDVIVARVKLYAFNETPQIGGGYVISINGKSTSA